MGGAIDVDFHGLTTGAIGVAKLWSAAQQNEGRTWRLLASWAKPEPFHLDKLHSSLAGESISMRKLTGEQRAQWDRSGYLILKNALSPEEVAFFRDELDRIRGVPGYEPVRAENMPIGHYGWLPHADSLDVNGFMDRRDLLPYGQQFIDLIDRPNVFDLIVDIMGPFLCLSMTQAIVRPPSDRFPGYTHTDGGEALRRIRVTETSYPLAMKALYFLTDVTEPDSGNITIFPGSHRQQIPFDAEVPVTPYSDGAVQIMANAGDCLLFPHSMWHGPCRNESDTARKTLLYNYCQLFMRQYDFGATTAIAEFCSPRQRRLLGDLGYDFRPGSYFYAPMDQVEVITNGEDTKAPIHNEYKRMVSSGG